jgi:hypothetical protein
MKITIYDDREVTAGRTTYLLNNYYLQPASAAPYRLTLLAKYHAASLRLYYTEKLKYIAITQKRMWEILHVSWIIGRINRLEM